MHTQVNIALQILPTPSEGIHPYHIVDKAIEVIASSGIKYRVTPFETVMEGGYAEIMDIVEKAQKACYEAGAVSLMTYIKIQSALTDVTIDDKMEKYD